MIRASERASEMAMIDNEITKDLLITILIILIVLAAIYRLANQKFRVQDKRRALQAEPLSCTHSTQLSPAQLKLILLTNLRFHVEVCGK